MTYLYLFLSFLKIGTLSFGGGYAALPLIQNEVITHYHWLSISDFTNLITISQMTPGPIAINAATFVGTKVGGIFGAIVATLGSILPSLILGTLMSYIYIKFRKLDFLNTILEYLRPCIIALILVSGVSLAFSSFSFHHLQIIPYILAFMALLLLMKYKKDPIMVILSCGIVNVLASFIITLFHLI